MDEEELRRLISEWRKDLVHNGVPFEVAVRLCPLWIY
jgi:hypothetical protein